MEVQHPDNRNINNHKRKKGEKKRTGKEREKNSKNREEGISNAVIQGKFSALKDTVF